MNLNKLNTIAWHEIETTEADVIIILRNSEKGMKVCPIWEYSCGFKNEVDMIASAENTLAVMLIEFADDCGGGETIGVCAFNWDNPKADRLANIAQAEVNNADPLDFGL